MSDIENREIVFIGKVTASITHEIKNVLASIKELTGLMDDLIMMSDEFPLKEKFQKTIPRILNQVERGNELTKNFNTFSHIPDNQIDTIDLGAVAEHLVYLSKRFARQKNIQLIVAEKNTSLEIETNPLHLYMGIFQVLEFLMSRMNNDGVIQMWAERSDEKNIINVIINGELTNREEFLGAIKSSDEWNDTSGIINSLNSCVEFNEAQNSITIEFPSVAHVNTV